MPCRKLTTQEYEDLMASNPGRTAYDTQAECQERSCCDTGTCCQEIITIGRCYRDEPGPFLPTPWYSNGGDPWQAYYRRCVGTINGVCNQADFSPPSNCSAYQEVCEPQPCYTDCVEYRQVCTDPNDSNSCYQECVRYGEICPPDNCYQECISFSGVDVKPCTDGDGAQSPRYYSNWTITNQGCSYCCNGECPMSPGVPCDRGACCGTNLSGQPYCLEFATPAECSTGNLYLPNGGTHHPGKFCSEVCPT